MTPLQQQAWAAQQLVRALRATGEEEAEAEALTIQSETDLAEVAGVAALAVLADEQHAEACKRLARELAQRALRLEARAQRRRGEILAALELAGQPGLHCPAATLSVGRSRPKVLVTDTTALPAAVTREEIRRVPDLERIAAMLADGEPVDGAVLSNGAPFLTIRTR